MEQKIYDVFISYSRKDYVQDGKIIPGNPISAIIELFDKNGISYWIDKDGIFVGEEFVKEISKAIANSRMLVFVSSKNSNESEYTCGEILKAKKEKKQIIPFRIDKCDYNEKFEILLLPLQHVDYFEQCDAALSVGDFYLYLVSLISGCQDAEVPFGQTFQPAAKICVFVLCGKLF